MKQFNDLLAKDPILRSVDQMWNANPLREVVPIDWAEITRALRTVWLHSLRKPEQAIASVAELNLASGARDRRLERGGQALVGHGTGAGPSPGHGAATPSDKRFAAPEWHSNPIYRTLKELYLLASDWLLKQGEIEGMDEAERRRLNFHLRQFVDAMSPSLLLRVQSRRPPPGDGDRRRQPGRGARNLLNDLKEGRLSIVDADGLRAGPQPRPDAGQGGPPQPADRADPVRAHDRDRAPDPAPDRAALDQQVLHPRHAAEEQHGAVPGRAGLHGLHRLLEEPGRVDGRHSRSRTTWSSARWRPARSCARSPAARP